MKILLLHDYGTSTGGAELQILSLKENLQARGHEVLLFASRAIQVEGFPQLADVTCFGTVTKARVLAQTANVSAYLRLRSLLQEFQPDIVHIRMFLTQLSPLILPLFKNIPCIYQTSVYNAICPVGTNVLPDGQRCTHAPGRVCLTSQCLTTKAWAALMVQQTLWQQWRHYVDCIVTLSHAMKRDLETAGLEPSDVIYNGVALSPPRPSLSEPPTVVYAGRLVPEKGVDVLVKAFAIAVAQVPHARLLIAGHGAAEASLRQLASQLGIADRISWLGHVPRDILEQQFMPAWVQVVPSLWAEPFGNVTTEAMARSTAVIAHAVGAQPEIIDDQVTGFLVPPGDIGAFARRLTQLLSCRELAERMGQAGRNRARTHFSEDRRTEQFLDLYQRLLQRYRCDSTVVSRLKVSSLS